jgi:hypothetical protein
MMAVLKFKEVAAEVKDPKMQSFLATLEKAAPDLKGFTNVARDEQPFISEIAWAYFSAYSTILLGSAMRLQVLRSGISDPERLLTSEPVKKILKAALPQMSKFIDDHEPETYYYLVETVETLLLSELRKTLEGDDADQAAAAKAKKIMEVVKAVADETAQNASILRNQ